MDWMTAGAMLMGTCCTVCAILAAEFIKYGVVRWYKHREEQRMQDLESANVSNAACEKGSFSSVRYVLSVAKCFQAP